MIFITPEPLMDPVLLELFKVLIPAVAGGLAAYWAYRAKKDTAESKERLADLHEGQAFIKDDVHRVEVATNGMKQALVAAEKAVSHTEGREAERIARAVVDLADMTATARGREEEQRDEAMRQAQPRTTAAPPSPEAP